MRDNLQYAVIIDAGSSGSRVYIYVWPPHTGDTRTLLNIRLLHDQLGKNVQHAITPGLSSCSADPSKASNYIAPLLDFAVANIPTSKHKETPLYILATAGMRLLDTDVQNMILEDLRKDIPKNYSFQFALNNVKVISGKEEGIYSWISINYLMGRFDHTLEKAPLVNVEFDKQNHLKRMSTISMLEMGGASVQISFEVTTEKQYQELKSRFPEETFKKMITEFNLGCSEHDTNHHYRLFVDTYLTLGANAARNEYVNYLINTSIETQSTLLNTSLATKETILFDPCLSIDSSDTIVKTLPSSGSNTSTSSQTQFLYHLKGSGDFEKCQEKLQKLVTTDGLNICANLTCPFQNLAKVSVPFRETDFYGLSEFWYSMNDIYGMGGEYSYNKFSEASKKYCSTSWLVTQDRYRRKLYPNADNKRLLYQCFKASWVTSLLHDGFRMPKNYNHFKSVSKLNNQPVQWTLGALIYQTRFFPLRSIDDQHGVHIHGGHVVKISTSYSFYIQFVIFGLCIVAVLSCILIYVKHLHKMTTTNVNAKSSTNYYRPLSSTIDMETYSAFPTERDRTNDHNKVFIGFN